MPGHRPDALPVRARPLRAAVALVLSALVLLVLPGRAGAGGAELSDAGRQLLEQYRPVVMIKAQDDLCSTVGEPFRPTSPSRVLDNPQIALRQLGTDNPVVTWAPGAGDLDGKGEGFFLDFPGDALKPACLYAKDGLRFDGEAPPVVLGRLVTQPDRPGTLVAQYWLYWYYNDWNNKHESDWEGIQVLFEAATAEEALAKGPAATGYAQHDGGERADWDSGKLQKEGTRPVVYSSRRSHASYYGSSLFMGRGAAEGFGCDNTDGPSTRLDPVLEVLPTDAAAAGATDAWLRYEGLWGERGEGPNNGPQGPNTKLRWDQPLDWQDTLRDSAFIVPAGDGGSEQLVSSFCQVVAFGSNQFNSFQYSPTKVLVTLVLLVLVGRFLVGRTDWRPVAPLPLVRRRSVGQVLRGAITVYRSRPLSFALLGLIVVPIGLVSALVGSVLQRLPIVGALVLRNEQGSGDLLFASLLAGIGTLLAITVTTATVVELMRAPDGRIGSFPDALRAVRRRIVPLVLITLPALAAITVLSFTLIGVPVAVWLIIRWSCLGQVVVLEERSGWAAFRRSGALVRHRWLRTTVVVAVLAAVLNGLGVVVSLLALVAFTGLPLWTLSLAGSIVQLLLVPLAGLVMSLLYGDAVAAEADRARARDDRAEPVAMAATPLP